MGVHRGPLRAYGLLAPAALMFVVPASLEEGGRKSWLV